MAQSLISLEDFNAATERVQSRKTQWHGPVAVYGYLLLLGGSFMAGKQFLGPDVIDWWKLLIAPSVAGVFGFPFFLWALRRNDRVEESESLLTCCHCGEQPAATAVRCSGRCDECGEQIVELPLLVDDETLPEAADWFEAEYRACPNCDGSKSNSPTWGHWLIASRRCCGCGIQLLRPVKLQHLHAEFDREHYRRGHKESNRAFIQSVVGFAIVQITVTILGSIYGRRLFEDYFWLLTAPLPLVLFPLVRARIRRLGQCEACDAVFRSANAVLATTGRCPDCGVIACTDAPDL